MSVWWTREVHTMPALVFINWMAWENYTSLQRSCNIQLAEHRRCEPISKQNSNFSAVCGGQCCNQMLQEYWQSTRFATRISVHVMSMWCAHDLPTCAISFLHDSRPALSRAGTGTAVGGKHGHPYTTWLIAQWHVYCRYGRGGYSVN